MIEYCSFDVFDTLITRTVGNPRDVFLITGKKASNFLNLNIAPELFVSTRIKAEERYLIRNSFPNIKQIYVEVGKQLDLPEEICRKLQNLELETELSCLVRIEKYIKLLERLRGEGKKIIYISDMYLPKKFLSEILKNKKIMKDGEDLFVSCEYNNNKESGHLFDEVLKALNINNKDLHHYGNSKASDINGAKRRGIKATFLGNGNSNRFENLISEYKGCGFISTSDLLRYSQISSSSKMARLNNTYENFQIYNIATSVAGPILFLFTLNVLRSSKDKKIYFLSRDGYILYEIAKKIKEKYKFDCELIYLNISREILITSRIKNDSIVDYIANLKKVYKTKTLQEFLSDFYGGSDYQYLGDKINSFLECELSEIEDHDLHDIIFSSNFIEVFQEEINKRKSDLNNYLKEEKFFQDERRVLVDVGWDLTIHDLLAEICFEKQITPPDGIYLGINKANSKISYGRKTGYLWDQRDYTTPRVSMPYIERIIEAFCSAPLGQVKGYKKTDSGYIPELKEYETQYLKQWGIGDLQNGILDFTDVLLENDFDPKNGIYDKNLCIELLEEFWMKPRKKEVRAWSTFPYFISKKENKVTVLHESDSLSKTLFLILIHGKVPQNRFNSWSHSEISTLHPYFKMGIKMYLKFRNILRSKYKKNINKIMASQ